MSGRRPALGLALVLAVGPLAGCASSGDLSSPWGAASDHEALERRLVALERQAARYKMEIDRLEKRLAELEAAASTNRAAPAAPAVSPAAPAPEGVTAITEVEPPPIAPRALIEESDLVEEQAAASAAPEAASYENGLRLLRDGRPAEAERELAAFALASPDSDLADNAWFWIGESRLARGDAEGALTAYRDAIDRYPDGNKVPDAMFKLGVAFEAAGDPAAAREAWGELLRRFPGSTAAERARERLARS